MNKRNRLQINNAEASMTSLHTDSIILNPKLTAGHEQPKINNFFHDGIDYSPAKAAEPAAKRHGMSLKASLRGVLLFARANALCIVLVLTIFYLLNRPSEYTLLIDEIYSLKEQNLTLRNRLGLKNHARLACGARAAALSPLYSYGFLRGSVSDPDSILEAAKDCLSLQGQQGAFEVRMGQELKIVRIGVYHPAGGSPRSAMRRFVVTIGQDHYAFVYRGSGYEEFSVDSTGDSVRWDIVDNQGDKRYTSVYQVYVYS